MSGREARARCPAVCEDARGLKWDGRWREVSVHSALCSCLPVVNPSTPPVIRQERTEFVGGDLPNGRTLAASFALCGDLNAVPGSRPYRRLRSVLRDPYPWHGWPLGTFPAMCPLLRLDHILLSPGWIVHRAYVPRTSLTSVASDHLPVVVDVALEAT